MDTKTIGDWIMYYEVQRLQKQGLSYRTIAQTLVMNRRTVIKYLAMSEAEYEAFLNKKDSRGKLLDDYETFVKTKLTAHPAASAAQVHDWLKEQHKDFPYISAKTVYNFVMAVRQKYSIALEETSREYFVVDELPYGLQAQADFGQYRRKYYRLTLCALYAWIIPLPTQGTSIPYRREHLKKIPWSCYGKKRTNCISMMIRKTSCANIRLPKAKEVKSSIPITSGTSPKNEKY